MNITIQVDEVTLDTVVGKTVGFDEDGDAYTTGEATVASMVATQIVDRLVKDERYNRLRDKVLEIRTEEIRAAIRPSIDEAIAKPIRKTNGYGEAVGGETTLSELVIEEARKLINEPLDRYGSNKGTFLSKAIAEAVQKAFAEEIAAAVKAAREQVSTMVGTQFGEQISAAVNAGLRAR